jgi:chemotaxis protein CheY-P-specific phosphatase CheC
MNHSNSIQKIFPFILENIAQEVGDLIGETLELQDENIIHGSLQKLFSPPKKKFVVTDLNLKENQNDPVHLLMELEMAVDLSGRLIMLPENEISAYQKQGKLDGEILDAFSEIVNIITGVVNSTCQEHIPQNKLYFIKGDPRILAPRSTDFPFPPAPHSLMSGTLISENGKPGIFRLFFPDTLVDANGESSQDRPEKTGGKKSFFEDLPAQELSLGQTDEVNQADEPDQADEPVYTEEPGPESTLLRTEPNRKSPQREDNPDRVSQPEKSLDIKDVAVFLLESLDSAREEIETLLGNSLDFSGQQTKLCLKKDILDGTRGKKILSRIDVSGDKQGEGYILLPLKDALFIGATLLLMPPEAITQSIKQGKFEGDLADAFGEIINILVGCYSNRFRDDFPIKLALKKGTVETLVASQVNPDSNQPFRADNYYMVSTSFQMEDSLMGPLEIFFPTSMLGLGQDIDVADSVAEKTPAGKLPLPPKSQRVLAENSQASSAKTIDETDTSQNIDTFSGVAPQENLAPVVIIIGQDWSQVEVLQEIFAEENLEPVMLSLDDNFRQYLNHQNLCCVFLLLEKLNEQAFANIIKVRALLPVGLPLIVTGPEWTQTSLVKAVKYGATDILISTAGKNSIRKKCYKHLYSNQE